MTDCGFFKIATTHKEKKIVRDYWSEIHRKMENMRDEFDLEREEKFIKSLKTEFAEEDKTSQDNQSVVLQSENEYTLENNEINRSINSEQNQSTVHPPQLPHFFVHYTAFQENFLGLFHLLPRNIQFPQNIVPHSVKLYFSHFPHN
jgi:hypothetical protein